MQKKERIYYLFSQFRKSQLSVTELAEWKLVLEDPTTENVLNDLMEDLWNNANDDIAPLDIENAQFIYQRVVLQKQNSSRQKILYLKWIAAAAILLIVGAIGFYTLTIPKGHLTKKDAVFSLEPTDYTTVDQPILYIEGNKKIKLDDVALGKIYEDNAFVVSKIKEGAVEYKAKFQNISSRAIQYKLIVPRKRTYEICLSDGTKVQLNAESSISFSDAFRFDRIVALDGEGYFDVTHKEYLRSKPSPFSVKTEKQKVTVLGTAFNMRAYRKETESTTLLRGKVLVEPLAEKTSQKHELVPGQQLKFENNTIFVNRVDVDRSISWLDGDFYFNGIRLDQVMRELSRWYDIDVDYKSLPNTKKFYGKIRRTSSIEEILVAIESTSDVKLIMKGRRIMSLN
ncbi:FecR family protein [Sphingobacterium puteale]|nr:FecR family protein [Sphingobacterium puteale]